MARMHSRAGGKSGSTKPTEKKTPTWIRYKAKETEALIQKMGKEGKTSSEIGLILRDSYGIPDVKTAVGKSITKILGEKNLLAEVPEDLRALIKKSAMVRAHLEENKQDVVAKRGLQLTESKIKRLVGYYKTKGKLEASWKYDPKRASTYLE